MIGKVIILEKKKYDFKPAVLLLKVDFVLHPDRGLRSSSSSLGRPRWGRNIPWFIQFPGFPRNPRGNISRLPIVHGDTSFIECHPRNLCGTSTEETAYL